ncbi:MAG: tetratricopeptide repeat protein, partial [Cyanobacteria bacterium P01_D01_bin.105]
FEVSWEPLSEEAKRLAGLLGLFAAAPVKWDWVEQAWALAGGEQAEAEMDEDALADGQAALLKVNLLAKAKEKEETGERRYGVHPLVREFFAVKLAGLAAAVALQQGFARAMTEVAKTIPQAVTVTVRAQVTDAVPHMEEVAQRWTAGLAEDDKTWCCIGLGRFYESLSQWSDAERYRLRALEISQAELGERHPYTASSLNNLAALYESQGRYGQAEPLLVQALEIRKAELGERHPYTASSLNNLAALYRAQGRYGEAEPLYVQALEIWKAELGDRHPYTASSLNNLAALYESQGRYGEAEPLYVQALEICQAELGDRHPYTASSLNNLAVLYANTNRFSQAAETMSQALSIRESQLGPEHPDTLSSKRSLQAIQQALEQAT